MMLFDSNSSRFPSSRPEILQEIESRFKKSLANKIYTFPRPLEIDDEEDSSSDSLENAGFYHLNEQNSKRIAHVFSHSSFRDSNRREDSFEAEMKKIDTEISFYLKKYNQKNREKTDEIKDLNHLSMCPNKKLKRSIPSYLKLLDILMKNNRKSISRMKTPSKSRSPNKEKEKLISKRKNINTIDDIIQRLTPQKKTERISSEKKQKFLDKRIEELITQMKRQENSPLPKKIDRIKEIEKQNKFDKEKKTRGNKFLKEEKPSKTEKRSADRSFRKNYHASSQKKKEHTFSGASKSESRHCTLSSKKKGNPITFTINNTIELALENLNLNLSVDDLILGRELESHKSPNYLIKWVKIEKKI
jgi:hypothetical protein